MSVPPPRDVYVISERKYRDMAGNREYKFESTDKYMKKLDATLAGKSFRLVLDDGQEIVLAFLTGETLLVGAYGEPMRWERYAALRADEQTYLVTYERTGQPERICDTYVLDLENSLVTRIFAKQHVIPGRDRMTINSVTFGAIKRDFEDLPMKRHSRTMDLVGKTATWHYANGFVNKHIYYDANYYRFEIQENPRLDERLSESEKEDVRRDEALNRTWFFDEPADYIKIKDGIYLISFVESNTNRLNAAKGGSNLVILINMKEGFDVCRSFTHTASQVPQWGMYKAYAEFEEDEGYKDREPSPFRT